MRFDREAATRGLNVVAPGNAPSFGGHSSLIFQAPKVLDDRVGKDNIKGLVSEVDEVAGITCASGDLRMSNGLRVQIDHGDFEPVNEFFHGGPEGFGSSKIEDAHGPGHVGNEAEEAREAGAAHFPSEGASLPTVGDAAEIEKHGGKMLKKLKWGKLKS
jgi:hypothetical protein